MIKRMKLSPMIAIVVCIVFFCALPNQTHALTERENPATEQKSKARKAQEIIVLSEGQERNGEKVTISNIDNVEALDVINIKTLHINDGENVGKIINELKKEADVKIVEKNKVRKLTSMVSSDPLFNDQDSLQLTNISRSWELLKKITPSNQQVVVGVLDSGIMTEHEDLQGQYVKGYNFINESTNVNDINGHGTAVSSVIAAKTNNNVGMAGIAGTANVKIMPLQIAYEDGLIFTSDIVKAINYAIKHNVDILNLSFAGSDYSQAENAAIQKAIKAGIIVIASSGNEGWGEKAYPASYPGVISVGSVNESKKRSYFSNYGSELDLTAPGEDIIAADLDGDYSNWFGTSFSAPHVTGIISMMNYVRPSIKLSEINKMLQATSLDLGADGHDNYYGEGLIQADKAVGAAIEGIPASPKVNGLSDRDKALVGSSKHKGYKVVAEADHKKIGESTVKMDGTFSIPIPLQNAGKKISVIVKNSYGMNSSSATVTVLDKSNPKKPYVRGISNLSTSVTGVTEPYARIEVFNGEKLLASGTANQKGDYSISIPKQKAFTKLTFYAIDRAENRSGANSITVTDKIAPARPTVYDVTNKSTLISGKGEPGTEVIVYYGNKLFTKGKVASNGKFYLKISPQLEGRKLKVYLKDQSGNKSGAVYKTVKDVKAPDMPTANRITSKSTAVYGRAEAYATIEVKVGSKLVAKGKVTSLRTYNIKMNKLKKGTYVKVNAVDKSGNRSKAKTMTVR